MCYSRYLKLLIFSLLSKSMSLQGTPFPMQFSIPESKIVKEIPHKDKDFAFIIPGNLSTYIYKLESDYYKDYQRSYFAITCKKAGWDALRHYEILANGCIPYFVDIDNCPSNTMCFLPKKLIKEAMNLEGVSYLHIDHTKFNRTRYYEILHQLLEHTRKRLTTRSMASYLLKTVKYSGAGNILYLSYDTSPDYQRCLTLIGLKEIFPNTVVDFPKIEHIYTSYAGDVPRLYGKGMTYSKVVDDLPINRDNIEQRIKNKEFDLIIYGSVHRGLLFHDLVTQAYAADKVIYMCGEDAHHCPYLYLPNLFLREF